MNAPRRAPRRILSAITFIVLAGAVSLATLSEIFPSFASGDGAVLFRTATVTASSLTSVARASLHRAAVVAVVASAKSASRTVTTFAKATAGSARMRKDGGCPLRNTGACPSCSKRGSLGA